MSFACGDWEAVIAACLGPGSGCGVVRSLALDDRLESGGRERMVRDSVFLPPIFDGSR
jgi:hypothetical protein